MAKDTGLIHEGGDRWKLDLLIPERDRIYTERQYEKHTLGIMSISKLKVASKPVINTVRGIDPMLRWHTPIHSAIETTMEAQRRMRGGDIALPGDRLL